MYRTRNIRPLTEFLRHSKELTARVESEREPLALTVNGKVKLVVLDAEAYEELVDLDRQRRLSELEAALAQIETGETHSLEAVRERARARYDVSS